MEMKELSEIEVSGWFEHEGEKYIRSAEGAGLTAVLLCFHVKTGKMERLFKTDMVKPVNFVEVSEKECFCGN